jgi:hypothetical protein
MAFMIPRTGSTRSQGRSWAGRSRVALLLQRILQAADGVLDLAFDLVALASSLASPVALPMVSLIEPLIFFTDPAIRSLSMSLSLRLLMLFMRSRSLD